MQQERDSIDILVDQQKYFGHKNRTKNPKCEDVLSDYRALTGYRIFISDFRLFYFLRIRKVSDIPHIMYYINHMISQNVKIQANKGIILQLVSGLKKEPNKISLYHQAAGNM